MGEKKMTWRGGDLAKKLLNENKTCNGSPLEQLVMYRCTDKDTVWYVLELYNGGIAYGVTNTSGVFDYAYFSIHVVGTYSLDKSVGFRTQSLGELMAQHNEKMVEYFSPNTIYNEHCFLTLERLRYCSVDMVIMSPPAKLETIIGGIGNEQEYLNFMENMFHKFNKALKKHSFVVFHFRQTKDNQDSIHKAISRIVDKTNFRLYDTHIVRGQRISNKDRTLTHQANMFDYIFVFCRKGESIDLGDTNVFARMVGRGILENYDSIGLRKDLIEYYGQNRKDMLLYDPFVENGINHSICKELGINFLGSNNKK